jgi:hypothetical protein
MRCAIEQEAARDGSLVGECLDTARVRGLSGEDTYVFLAYQILLRLEETHHQHVYLCEDEPDAEGGRQPRLAPTAHLAAYLRRLAATLPRPGKQTRPQAKKSPGNEVAEGKRVAGDSKLPSLLMRQAG